MENSKIDFHKFVDQKLAESGHRIELISEDFLKNRLEDIIAYVNGIRLEYSKEYGWKAETREYFLNGLNDKWKYSFAILNDNNEFRFLNFSSVYGDIIHNHCTYAYKKTRGLNFAKLHIIKLCQTGLDYGFTHQEGYWPKHNNGSIILYLRMGWKIESIRNNTDLFMIADLLKVRDKTYELYLGGK